MANKATIPHLHKQVCDLSNHLEDNSYEAKTTSLSSDKPSARCCPICQVSSPVVRAISYSLSSVASSKELCSVIRDAIQVISDLHSRTGELHDGIAPGKILIHSDGSGMLVNWDLCQPQPQAHYSQRQGTWPFLPDRIVRGNRRGTDDDPSFPPQLRHDLESFFWILCYHTLRYTRTGLTGRPLEQYIEKEFKVGCRSPWRCGRHGGPRRIFSLMRESPRLKDVFSTSLLGQLIFELRAPFILSYQDCEWSVYKLEVRQKAVADLRDASKVLKMFDEALGKPGWEDECNALLRPSQARLDPGPIEAQDCRMLLRNRRTSSEAEDKKDDGLKVPSPRAADVTICNSEANDALGDRKTGAVAAHETRR